MKKVYLVFITIFYAILNSQAQQVIWEKTYGWNYSMDDVYSIEPIGNGYLAGGASDKLGYTWRDSTTRYGFKPGAILIRLNNNGDTIKTINLGCLGRVCSIKKCPDGNFYSAVCAVDSAARYYGVRLFKLSPDGNVLWYHDYPQSRNWYAVWDMCMTSDGGTLLVGSKDADWGSGGLTDGFVMRIDPNGNELWRKIIRPNSQTYIFKAEVISHSDKSFLISGCVGAQIYVARLDSMGNFITQTTHWTDPENTILWWGAWALQSPDGSYIVIGQNSRENNPLYYMAKYNQNGEQLWENTYSGICSSPFVNSAGYIMLTSSTPNGHFFRKFRPDGYLANAVLLTQSVNYGKKLYCAAWSDNDSAVFAGYYGRDRFSAEDFYFVKMSGVGNQFVTAVEPAIVSEPQTLSVYPNPARESFSISSKIPGLITIYTTSGQTVLSRAYMPGDKTDISGFAPGLYLYRFSSAGGVRTGKIVKE
ncbi:MAG: T9SS type A sorting domain-containing protein [Bacteroidota bacterium]